jgi:LuxR family maltose regulon positive regulatory protein
VAEQVEDRLGAAQIRLELARCGGDLGVARAAVEEAERMLGQIKPEVMARHPELRGWCRASRGLVELWDGRFDEAAAVLGPESGTVFDGEGADRRGYLALAEVLRGRLARVPEIAAAASRSGAGSGGLGHAAAEVALAWVHLEHYQPADARCALERAEDDLRARPDKLMAGLVCLVAAWHRLAIGQADAALTVIERASDGWSPPRWLAHLLMLAESHARATLRDLRAGRRWDWQVEARSGPVAAVALARCLLAADDSQTAGEVLTAAPATGDLQGHAGVEACLVHASLGYRAGDANGGRGWLERALRLAGPERVVLPFRLERAWLERIAARDPGLAVALRRLSGSGPELRAGAAVSPHHESGPNGNRRTTQRPAPVVVDELSDREREVLQRASLMLSTAEIADELYVSVNTVKSHLRSIFRKLGAARRGEAVRRARELQLL